jgi:putative restriction endonuclease
MSDLKLRADCFAALDRRIELYGTTLSWSDISMPFVWNGQRVFISGRARGIFKPKQLVRGVLSIKTSVPRSGRSRRYIDEAGEGGTFLYRFMGNDPESPDNRALRESMEDRTPLVYFFGVSPTQYACIYPVYITEWNKDELYVKVQASTELIVGKGKNKVEESVDLRRYANIEARARLHQAAFRADVLRAYGVRCALSGLPVPRLLVAAHIIPDSHPDGIPSVSNGLCLSAVHHEAYDASLLGISPDCKIVVSPEILNKKDGCILQAFKELDGTHVKYLPRSNDDQPDPKKLAVRWEKFQSRWA